MKIKTLSVTQINQYISRLIKTNPLFLNLSIEGEVLNFKKTNYGYSFFSLVDEFSKINCFAGPEVNLENLQEGMQIVAQGALRIYEKGGTYSIHVNSFAFVGQGMNFEEYLKIKHELQSQGYFDVKYKKSIPQFPSALGIITSATGAAIQDIINVVSSKYPLVKLYLYSVAVQGSKTAQDVINGLDYFNKQQNVDTIIITRGGGSKDDLSAFNNRELALKIFESKIAVISAVGHETDYSISDFVSDFRAATPSIAADKAVPNKLELLERLYTMKKQLDYRLSLNLSGIRNRLESQHSFLAINKPVYLIEKYKQRAEFSHKKLENDIKKIIFDNRQKIDSLGLKLNLIYPINILQRGYSIVEKNGKKIRSKNSLQNKDEITIFFQDGSINAKIIDG